MADTSAQGKYRGVNPSDRLTLRTVKTEGCWNFGNTPGKYGKLQICGKTVSAHRFAYEQLHGPIPEGMVVRHSCDNPQCVRPDHLSLGAPVENSRDMTSRDRQAKGSRQGSARLSPADVIAMREARAAGATYRDLASQFGVSTSQVGNVITGHDWGHLPGAVAPTIPNRLTKEQSANAVQRVRNGETHQSVADSYGVSRASISKLMSRTRQKEA